MVCTVYQVCVCFWGSPEFKGGINVIVYLYILFISLHMLLSLKILVTPATSDSAKDVSTHMLPFLLFETLVCSEFLYYGIIYQR